MEYFVARQPIFDRESDVYAYELLFRTGLTGGAPASSGEQATASVLNHSLFSIGLDHLTAGKLAFVNFTESLLLEGLATILPNDAVGIEVLESVRPSAAVVERCRQLKERGFLIALDDFRYTPAHEPLLDFASIVKIDVMNTPEQECKQMVELLRHRDVKMVAEKVETLKAHREAIEQGFDYFQGYYFTKPEIVSGQETPVYKLNQLQMLQQIHNPELDFDELEQIFRQDVSLSYKLLRYVNSAYFGPPREIRSIRHALALIGMREAKKWLSLIALSSMADDKPLELVRMSLLRANLCEMLAPLFYLQDSASELFLMGLFSLIDVLIDQPMPALLTRLPLGEPIKRSLLRQNGPYQLIFDIVVAYERGEWDVIFKNMHQFDFRLVDLTDCFVKTIQKSNQMMSLQ